MKAMIVFVRSIGLAPLAVTAVVAANGGYTVEDGVAHPGPPVIRMPVHSNIPALGFPFKHIDADWTTAQSVWLDYVIYGEVRTSAS